MHYTDLKTYLRSRSTGNWKIDHERHRQHQLHHGEDKIKRQDNTTYNTKKNDTIPLKTSDPIMARHEQININETEGNDSK